MCCVTLSAAGALGPRTPEIEIIEQNRFNPAATSRFDTQMRQSYSDVQATHPKVVSTPMGHIFQDFYSNGVAATAYYHQDACDQADQIEQQIISSEGVSEAYDRAMVGVLERQPIATRVASWQALRAAFVEEHRIITEKKIPGFDLWYSPHDTMIANRDVALLPAHQHHLRVALFVQAYLLSRIENDDIDAFSEL
jgi:hypothetical protein